MNDSDFEIEDSIELVPLFEDPDIFWELETPVDWSDSYTDILEDQCYEHNQELIQEISNRENQSLSILAQLEGFALDLVEQLQRGNLPIQLNLVKQRDLSLSRLVLKWPTKSGSIKKFVIELIQEAIICGIPVTKRFVMCNIVPPADHQSNDSEIFYRDVALFRNQSVVDNLVELIARTLDMPRRYLNVKASPKGLFCGSGLKIGLSRGDTIQGADSEGLLIPPSEEIAWLKVSEDISWILVVEKEAVFQSLAKSSFVSGMHPLGPGVMITGKGYPDFATLELTKQLSLIVPQSVPIGAIVDCDPYGLDILSMYKYGGGRLNREERFATSRIKWLGVWASEISGLRISNDDLLPLTKHDVKKCLELLTRDPCDMPLRWKRELSRMLFNRRKAEIEVLLSVPKAPLRNQNSVTPESGLSFLLRYLLAKINDVVLHNQEM